MLFDCSSYNHSQIGSRNYGSKKKPRYCSCQPLYVVLGLWCELAKFAYDDEHLQLFKIEARKLHLAPDLCLSDCIRKSEVDKSRSKFIYLAKNFGPNQHYWEGLPTLSFGASTPPRKMTRPSRKRTTTTQKKVQPRVLRSRASVRLATRSKKTRQVRRPKVVPPPAFTAVTSQLKSILAAATTAATTAQAAAASCEAAVQSLAKKKKTPPPAQQTPTPVHTPTRQKRPRDPSPSPSSTGSPSPTTRRYQRRMLRKQMQNHTAMMMMRMSSMPNPTPPTMFPPTFMSPMVPASPMSPMVPSPMSPMVPHRSPMSNVGVAFPPQHQHNMFSPYTTMTRMYNNYYS